MNYLTKHHDMRNDFFLKSGREAASFTIFGRLFQIFGAANAMERSPADLRFVFGTLRRISQLERRKRQLVCMTRRSRRYLGWLVDSTLYVIIAILNLIRYLMGSQCNFTSPMVIWSYLRYPRIMRAAAF